MVENLSAGQHLKIEHHRHLHLYFFSSTASHLSALTVTISIMDNEPLSNVNIFFKIIDTNESAPNCDLKTELQTGT